jgi:hypothetical protein
MQKEASGEAGQSAEIMNKEEQLDGDSHRPVAAPANRINPSR